MAQNPAQPPQALEAEMAVLGSMLIENEAVAKALERVEDGDFYKDAHRTIFAAIQALFTRGTAADLVTVGRNRASASVGRSPTKSAKLRSFSKL